jgi:hypothetical protein
MGCGIWRLRRFEGVEDGLQGCHDEESIILVGCCDVGQICSAGQEFRFKKN